MVLVQGDPSMAYTPFRLEVQPERDAVRVCPFGELDVATTGAVRERIQELKAVGFRCVVLDLRGLTFMDSTGIRLLLEADDSSRADGWELRIVRPQSPEVQRACRIAGLDGMLPFLEPGTVS